MGESEEIEPSEAEPAAPAAGGAAAGGAAAGGADGGKTAAKAGAAPAQPAAPKRDSRFRRQLLDKLPRLAYAGWSAQDNLKIDQEWTGVINTQADAILGPLEKLAPERLR